MGLRGPQPLTVAVPGDDDSTTASHRTPANSNASWRRRESFANFLLSADPTFDGLQSGQTKDSRDKLTRLSHGRYQRLAHAAAILGYGLTLSMLMLVVIFGLQLVQWTKKGPIGGELRLDHWAVLHFMICPSMFSICLVYCTNIFQCNAFLDGGPRLARVTLGCCLVLAPAFYGAMAAPIKAGFEVRHWCLDLFLWVLFGAMITVVDVPLRSALSVTATAPDDDEALNVKIDESTKATRWTAFLNAVPFFANLTILAGYPLWVIPLFFSSGTSTRLFICLCIHPLMLEAAEAGSRGWKAEAVAKELRQGKITLEVAEARITQGSLDSFVIKQVMALYKRLMLQNMLDPRATLTAFGIASFEEAILRGYIVQIDSMIRKLRGKPKLRGNELRLQRLVWMCDSNLSCIAEFNAIFTSTFAYVLLRRQALVFAIGHEPDIEFDAGIVCLQLLVEVALEVLVDNTLLFAEAEHGVPVTDYFKLMNGLAVFVFHAATSAAMFYVAMFSFIRYPHAFSCDSSDVCECIEQTMLKPWRNHLMCRESGNASTITTSAASDNGTATLIAAEDLADISVVLLSGSTTMAIIALSVLYARYRKKNAKIFAAERAVEIATSEAKRAHSTILSLKASLANAQRIIDEVVAEGGSLLRHYELIYDELIFKGPLGEGAFGTVSLGIHRGSNVAIKTVRTTKISKETIKQFVDEIKIMAPLRHENVVGFIGGCWKQADRLCIVLEYCPGGSLLDLLKCAASKHFTWVSPFFEIAVGVARCFKYLHHDLPGDPLTHRDLKPANVLVGGGYVPKVADFGEARRFQEIRAHGHDEAAPRSGTKPRFGEDVLTMTRVGTPMYTAPEILIDGQYNPKCDTYSYAMLVFEVACTCVGEAEDFARRQFMTVGMFGPTKGWRPKPPIKLKNTAILSLVRNMWAQNAQDRPPFPKILEQLRKEIGPSGALLATSDSAHTVEQYRLKTKAATEKYGDVEHAQLCLKLCKADEQVISYEAEINALKTTGLRMNMSSRDGILGGMYTYDPDMQSSIVGNGAFGVVYRMTNPYDGARYAAQNLSPLKDIGGKTDVDAMFAALDELKRTSCVRTDYIVRCVTACAFGDQFYLISQFVHGLNVRDAIFQRRKSGYGDFTAEMVELWARQLAKGLYHLHDECGLVHQSLHSRNVMIAGTQNLTSNNLCLSTQVKILDLGLSSFKEEHKRRMASARLAATQEGNAPGLTEENARAFTMVIQAPETIGGCNSSAASNSKVDMWALGVVLCELCLLRPTEEWYPGEQHLPSAIANPDLKADAFKLLQDTKTRGVEKRSENLGLVVNSLLSLDPEHRFSAFRVLTELGGSPASADIDEANVCNKVNEIEETLAAFCDVESSEIAAVSALYRESFNLAGFSRLPRHAGDCVALLRCVREKNCDGLVRVKRLMKNREKLGCTAMYDEIVQRKLSLHTLPGCDTMVAATFQTNEWAGVDYNGDLVSYGRWGAVDVPKMSASVGVREFARWDAFRREARAMVLCELSHRASRVVMYSIVIDAAGLQLADIRKAIPYIKEFAAGEAVWATPDARTSTYLIRSYKIASKMFGMVKRLGMIDGNLQATVFIIPGHNPFESSSDFAALYGRHVLPTTVGGSLQIGDDDDCCLGVELPAVSDANALWVRYGELRWLPLPAVRVNAN